MASSRITWQTVDQAMTRWSAVLGVLAVLAAVLAAYRFVSRALVEGIAASVLLVILLVGWWATSRLHRARVTLGEDGIIREGRGGFTLPWDQVRMVGIGEGLVSEVPYLVIATRRRCNHPTALAAAGSGLRRPSAAAPLDAGMQDQVRAALMERGVFRTEEQWNADL